MSYRIVEIKIKTIEKENGEKEYVVWAEDNHGRPWRVDTWFGCGDTNVSLGLGMPEDYHANKDKEGLIARIKKYIEAENKERERMDGLQAKKESIETISL